MSKNIYPCNVCDRVFKSSQALNGHKRSHTDYKLPIYYCCSILTRQEVDVRNLNSHEQAYIRKLKKCPICNKDHINEIFCSHHCSAINENNNRKSRGWIHPRKITKKRKRKKDIYCRVWFLNCSKCNLLHTSRSHNKKYCNSCRLTFKKKYKLLCSFSLNKTDHPSLFNSELIIEYGWYSPASTKQSNLLGVTWDHLYPLHVGFENSIEPKIMNHPANAELVPHRENLRRYHYKKSLITLDELFQRIELWDSGFRDLPIFYK